MILKYKEMRIITINMERKEKKSVKFSSIIYKIKQEGSSSQIIKFEANYCFESLKEILENPIDKRTTESLIIGFNINKKNKSTLTLRPDHLVILAEDFSIQEIQPGINEVHFLNLERLKELELPRNSIDIKLIFNPKIKNKTWGQPGICEILLKDLNNSSAN